MARENEEESGEGDSDEGGKVWNWNGTSFPRARANFMLI